MKQSPLKVMTVYLLNMKRLALLNVLEGEMMKLLQRWKRNFNSDMRKDMLFCIDPLFTQWLSKKHPESLIHSESTCIADEFSYIKPLSPLNTEILETINKTEANFTDGEEDTENNKVNDASTDINKQVSDLSTETSFGTEGTFILSKVLVNHMPQVTPVSLLKQSKPKSRLLTSTECLKMLQEKEAKKKQQLEEKGQR